MNPRVERRRKSDREQDQWAQELEHKVIALTSLIKSIKGLVAALLAAYPLAVTLTITVKGAWTDVLRALFVP